MNIIDCHANVGWDISNLRKNLIPVEQSFRQLLEKMDTYGIATSIMVPFPSPGAQFHGSGAWYDVENQYLMDAANYSKRLLPFPGVNPQDENSVNNIKSAVLTSAVKGIKFSHQVPMGFSIEKLIGHPLMKIVMDNNLVFMMHIGTGKEPKSDTVHVTLEYAVKVAQHYPSINFIFCHLGRLHWSIIEALNLANVHMDTAGLSLWQHWSQFIAKEPLDSLKSLTPSGVIEKLVKWGYEDKIIFGSDEPYTNIRDEKAIISDAAISEAAKRKIVRGNISKLLGI